MRQPFIIRWSFYFLLLQATSPYPLLRYSFSLYLLISSSHLLPQTLYFRYYLLKGYFLVSLSLKSDSCEFLHKANTLCCFIGWQYLMYVLMFGYIIPSGITILNEESCQLMKRLNHQPLLRKVRWTNKHVLCKLHNLALDSLVAHTRLGQDKPFCACPYMHCSVLGGVEGVVLYPEMAAKESSLLL